AEAGATVEYADLPMVSGERLLLVQLFQNLIGNAIKFRSEATPHITITAAKAAAGAPDASADCDPPQDRDDLVTIAVRDNGIGIASGDRERIFQIFQRSDPNGAHPGSGIGLAIVKKIVTSHSGRVSLESAPGAGSTFYVTLPGAHDPVPTRP
ncbi:MAG: ATP-binding protein, partial [Myxococcota bacterium]